jgi:hypothetical protein
MATYPLSVPSGLKVKRSSFRLVRAVQVSESPFTFTEQVKKQQGERWEGEVTLTPYKRDGVAEIQAFLAKLRGRRGTFLYGDPDYLSLGPRGTASGTPLINGSFSRGDNTISVDGFTISQSNVVRAGDYLQLDSSSNAELYMVVDDANSDGSGNASINIEPALRSAPADNEAVTITGAKGVFRLTENTIEWSANQSNVYQVSFAFREAIDE